MVSHAERLKLAQALMGAATDRNLMFQQADDAELDGRHIRVDGRSLLHFGSCSYLGLEFDDKIRSGAIDAIQRYGTQFSSSRAYVSAPQYRTLEAALKEIFDAHVIVTPSTTLAHMSALPVVVGSDDLVLLDQQVHQSVQSAAQSTTHYGARVEILKHGRLDLLEERLQETRSRPGCLWYLIDGIYSMFGDGAPMAMLRKLLDEYGHFRLYVDDAHGMSWTGKNGSGYALKSGPLHPHAIMTTSLNKSFAAGGGAIVLPTRALADRVRYFAGPITFSGPIQPPMLGAALASAQIHLSSEITELQHDLSLRIENCNRLLAERNLPVMSNTESPIRFIGAGGPAATLALGEALLKEGFFVNAAGFPAVPIKCCGIRFTLTRLQRTRDLEALIESIDRNLRIGLAADGRSMESLNEQLGLEARTETPVSSPDTSISISGAPSLELKVKRFDSIEKISREDWNSTLGSRGGFSWEGLRFLERTFGEDRDPGNCWRFVYFQVVDSTGSMRAQTVFSEALWKDDMLAPVDASAAIEMERVRDPYFLTTSTFAMGSQLTEGSHLYIDPTLSKKQREQALDLILYAVSVTAKEMEVGTIVLRDFEDNDSDRDLALLKHDFLKLSAPSSYVIELDDRSEAERIAALSARTRRHHARSVEPWNDHYLVEVIAKRERTPTPDEFDHMWQLYMNVKQQNLGLNTFALPRDFFRKVFEDAAWELVLMHPADSPSATVGVFASLIGRKQYVPTVVGLDYDYVHQAGLYRQCLRQAVKRARTLGLRRIHLGLGADLEKARFGAREIKRCIYVQSDDHYGSDAVEQFSRGAQN